MCKQFMEWTYSEWMLNHYGAMGGTKEHEYF